ncbi:MAG: uroporphyrinogen decarboxylase [Alphaproteobacteria bacterium]|nr:uroporphyrinogen decarboxylase [Alphaproteobacteria bacterium]
MKLPMQTQKIMLTALKGKAVERPPYWFMRQAGRYLPEYLEIRKQVGGILELCYTPALAGEVTLQPVRRFDTDAAILFADILVIADALGQKVAFLDGEGPILDPICDHSAVKELQPNAAQAKLAPILETVARVRADLAPDKALIGFAGAPWTVATYMVEGRSSRDYARIKDWAYRSPETFQNLIDILIDATIAYLKGQIGAGVDIVQIFDTWAGVLPPAQVERWVIEPTKSIVAGVREAYPDTPIIGFPRGLGSGYCRYATETKVTAVSLDTAVDPVWAAQHLQPICAVQGNLDPGMLAVGGPTMQTETQQIVSTLGGGPFVFNLGHGIWPMTPPKHLEELSRLLRGWRYA